MATSMDPSSDSGGMIVKSVSVPVGLEELMEGLSKEVLRKKPKDIYKFASDYFARLLVLREKGNYKAKPVKAIQSITKQISPKVSPRQFAVKPQPIRPIRQLSRQMSIRDDSRTKKIATPTTETERPSNNWRKRRAETRRGQNIPTVKESNSSTEKDSKVSPITEIKEQNSIIKRDRSISNSRRGRASVQSVQSTPRQRSQSITTKSRSSTDSSVASVTENIKTKSPVKMDKSELSKANNTIVASSALLPLAEGYVKPLNSLGKIENETSEKLTSEDADTNKKSVHKEGEDTIESNTLDNQNIQRDMNVDNEEQETKKDETKTLLEKETGKVNIQNLSDQDKLRSINVIGEEKITDIKENLQDDGKVVGVDTVDGQGKGEYETRDFKDIKNDEAKIVDNENKSEIFRSHSDSKTDNVEKPVPKIETNMEGEVTNENKKQEFVNKTDKEEPKANDKDPHSEVAKEDADLDIEKTTTEDESEMNNKSKSKVTQENRQLIVTGTERDAGVDTVDKRNKLGETSYIVETDKKVTETMNEELKAKYVKNDNDVSEDIQMDNYEVTNTGVREHLEKAATENIDVNNIRDNKKKLEEETNATKKEVKTNTDKEDVVTKEKKAMAHVGEIKSMEMHDPSKGAQINHKEMSNILKEDNQLVKESEKRVEVDTLNEDHKIKDESNGNTVKDQPKNTKTNTVDVKKAENIGIENIEPNTQEGSANKLKQESRSSNDKEEPGTGYIKLTLLDGKETKDNQEKLETNHEGETKTIEENSHVFNEKETVGVDTLDNKDTLDEKFKFNSDNDSQQNLNLDAENMQTQNKLKVDTNSMEKNKTLVKEAQPNKQILERELKCETQKLDNHNKPDIIEKDSKSEVNKATEENGTSVRPTADESIVKSFDTNDQAPQPPTDSKEKIQLVKANALEIDKEEPPIVGNNDKSEQDSAVHVSDISEVKNIKDKQLRSGNVDEESKLFIKQPEGANIDTLNDTKGSDNIKIEDDQNEQAPKTYPKASVISKDSAQEILNYGVSRKPSHKSPNSEDESHKFVLQNKETFDNLTDVANEEGVHTLSNNNKTNSVNDLIGSDKNDKIREDNENIINGQTHENGLHEKRKKTIESPDKENHEEILANAKKSKTIEPNLSDDAKELTEEVEMPDKIDVEMATDINKLDELKNLTEKGEYQKHSDISSHTETNDLHEKQKKPSQSPDKEYHTEILGDAKKSNTIEPSLSGDAKELTEKVKKPDKLDVEMATGINKLDDLKNLTEKGEHQKHSDISSRTETNDLHEKQKKPSQSPDKEYHTEILGDAKKSNTIEPSLSGDAKELTEKVKKPDKLDVEMATGINKLDELKNLTEKGEHQKHSDISSPTETNDLHEKQKKPSQSPDKEYHTEILADAKKSNTIEPSLSGDAKELTEKVKKPDKLDVEMATGINKLDELKNLTEKGEHQEHSDISSPTETNDLHEKQKKPSQSPEKEYHTEILGEAKKSNTIEPSLSGDAKELTEKVKKPDKLDVEMATGINKLDELKNLTEKGEHQEHSDISSPTEPNDLHEIQKKPSQSPDKEYHTEILGDAKKSNTIDPSLSGDAKELTEKVKKPDKLDVEMATGINKLDELKNLTEKGEHQEHSDISSPTETNDLHEIQKKPSQSPDKEYHTEILGDAKKSNTIDPSLSGDAKELTTKKVKKPDKLDVEMATSINKLDELKNLTEKSEHQKQSDISSPPETNYDSPHKESVVIQGTKTELLTTHKTEPKVEEESKIFGSENISSGNTTSEGNLDEVTNVKVDVKEKTTSAEDVKGYSDKPSDPQVNKVVFPDKKDVDIVDTQKPLEAASVPHGSGKISKNGKEFFVTEPVEMIDQINSNHVLEKRSFNETELAINRNEVSIGTSQIIQDKKETSPSHSIGKTIKDGLVVAGNRTSNLISGEEEKLGSDSLGHETEDTENYVTKNTDGMTITEEPMLLKIDKTKEFLQNEKYKYVKHDEYLNLSGVSKNVNENVTSLKNIEAENLNNLEKIDVAANHEHVSLNEEENANTGLKSNECLENNVEEQREGLEGSCKDIKAMVGNIKDNMESNAFTENKETMKLYTNDFLDQEKKNVFCSSCKTIPLHGEEKDDTLKVSEVKSEINAEKLVSTPEDIVKKGESENVTQMEVSEKPEISKHINDFLDREKNNVFCATCKTIPLHQTTEEATDGEENTESYKDISNVKNVVPVESHKQVEDEEQNYSAKISEQQEESNIQTYKVKEEVQSNESAESTKMDGSGNSEITKQDINDFLYQEKNNVFCATCKNIPLHETIGAVPDTAMDQNVITDSGNKDITNVKKGVALENTLEEILKAKDVAISKKDGTKLNVSVGIKDAKDQLKLRRLSDRKTKSLSQSHLIQPLQNGIKEKKVIKRSKSVDLTAQAKILPTTRSLTADGNKANREKSGKQFSILSPREKKRQSSPTNVKKTSHNAVAKDLSSHDKISTTDKQNDKKQLKLSHVNDDNSQKPAEKDENTFEVNMKKAEGAQSQILNHLKETENISDQNEITKKIILPETEIQNANKNEKEIKKSSLLKEDNKTDTSKLEAEPKVDEDATSGENFVNDVASYTKSDANIFGSEIKKDKISVEELKNNESKEKQSALKIQALWRGYKVRKNIVDVKNRLQPLDDSLEQSNKHKLTDADIMKAATIIQARIRGFLERKKYKAKRAPVQPLERIVEECSGNTEEKKDLKESSATDKDSSDHVHCPCIQDTKIETNRKNLRLQQDEKEESSSNGELDSKYDKQDTNKDSEIKKHNNVLNDPDEPKLNMQEKDSPVSHNDSSITSKSEDVEENAALCDESEHFLKELDNIRVPTDDPVVAGAERPEFYKSETVEEPEIIKKIYLPTTDHKGDSHVNDDNNNSQGKDLTPLEQEVKHVIQKISQSDEETCKGIASDHTHLYSTKIIDDANKEIVPSIDSVSYSQTSTCDTSNHRDKGNTPHNENEKMSVTDKKTDVTLLKKPQDEEENVGSVTPDQSENQKVTKGIKQEGVQNLTETNGVKQEEGAKNLTETVKLQNIIEQDTTHNLEEKSEKRKHEPAVAETETNIEQNKLQKVDDTTTVKQSTQTLTRTDAFEEHVGLIDQVQNQILDHISGSSTDGKNKFDIDLLRKELEEAAMIYKEDDDGYHGKTDVNDELLDYLSDFESEEESRNDSILSSIKELPAIEEEDAVEAADDKQREDKAKLEPMGIIESKETETPFCKTLECLGKKESKVVDGKRLKDLVEVISMDEAAKNTESNNNTLLTHNKLRTADNGKSEGKPDDSLVATTIKNEHADSSNMNTASLSQEQGPLLHTGELHDSLIFIPSSHHSMDEHTSGEKQLSDNEPEIKNGGVTFSASHQEKDVSHTSKVLKSESKRKSTEALSFTSDEEAHSTDAASTGSAVTVIENIVHSKHPVASSRSIEDVENKKEDCRNKSNNEDKTVQTENSNQMAQHTQPPAGAQTVTSQRPYSPRSTQTPGAVINRTQSGVDAQHSESAMDGDRRRNNAFGTTNANMTRNIEAEAATKIQAGFRGYQVRKQIRGSKDDNQKRSIRRKSSGLSVGSSCHCKGKGKLKKAPNSEEEAAIKIQAGVRGFLVRKKQKKDSMN